MSKSPWPGRGRSARTLAAGAHWPSPAGAQRGARTGLVVRVAIDAAGDEHGVAGAQQVSQRHWLWHWATPESVPAPWTSWRRVALDNDARRRKQAAIAAHESQLQDLPGHPAVLPEWALARLLGPWETFIDEGAS